MTCKARQHSDQMVCDRCNLCWDMNDPDPPECKIDIPVINHGTAERINRNIHEKKGRRFNLGKIKKLLRPDHV